MTYKSAVKILVMAAALLAWLMGGAQAGTLEDIKAKGILTVAVKADYPPFGFRNASGELVGLEVDLAKDVAQRLGVKLQLEPVVASNRMQMIQQNKVDLMIATMTVNSEREKAVGVIKPYYYADGVALLTGKQSRIKSASDLAGKRVCIVQGSLFADDVAKLAGRAPTVFQTAAEAERALLSGHCAGFAYHSASLIYLKNAEEDKWGDYEVVELDIAPMPWGVAVKQEEKDTPWGKFVEATATDWQKNGVLVDLEKKWLGQNTAWLVDQRNAQK